MTMEDTRNITIPIEITRRENNGRAYIYDTLTRERSEVLETMLPQQLRKKRADGSLVFTTQQPLTPPNRGTLKCLLHPDSASSKHYDSLGLVTCLKSNLTSPFQVRRHMEKRHRIEWQTIDQERLSIEREEEKEFHRALIQTRTTEKAPLYVSAKDKISK